MILINKKKKYFAFFINYLISYFSFYSYNQNKLAKITLQIKINYSYHSIVNQKYFVLWPKHQLVQHFLKKPLELTNALIFKDLFLNQIKENIYLLECDQIIFQKILISFN